MEQREVLKVIAGAPDRPLVISGVEIPCYVLEDESRVLSQRGITTGIGLNPDAGFRMPHFLSSKHIKPFVSNELMPALKHPILFKNPSGGGVAHGYPATLLVDICKVILSARDARNLTENQKHIAQRADILIRGLATVGIVALVDEATGYQEIREQRALATILEKFIAADLQPWTKTFPIEFYREIFRLKQWTLDPQSQRPSVLGHYTNEIVYRRLAPGVLNELQRKNPTLPTGRRESHHHRWFTPEIGHPKLKEHLAAVIALMKISDDWVVFQERLTTVYPKRHEQIPMFSRQGVDRSKNREPGLRADYKGATPEEVARAVLKYRPK